MMLVSRKGKRERLGSGLVGSLVGWGRKGRHRAEGWAAGLADPGCSVGLGWVGAVRGLEILRTRIGYHSLKRCAPDRPQVLIVPLLDYAYRERQL